MIPKRKKLLPKLIAILLKRAETSHAKKLEGRKARLPIHAKDTGPGLQYGVLCIVIPRVLEMSAGHMAANKVSLIADSALTSFTALQMYQDTICKVDEAFSLQNCRKLRSLLAGRHASWSNLGTFCGRKMKFYLRLGFISRKIMV